MYVGADVVLFSGSLNTLSVEAFYRTLQHAYEAAAEEVVFNYLCSPELAGTQYLTWHKPRDVLEFARRLTPHARSLNGYISGDCSVSMRKKGTPTLTLPRSTGRGKEFFGSRYDGSD